MAFSAFLETEHEIKTHTFCPTQIRTKKAAMQDAAVADAWNARLEQNHVSAVGECLGAKRDG